MWVRRTFQVGRQAANKSVAFFALLLFSPLANRDLTVSNHHPHYFLAFSIAYFSFELGKNTPSLLETVINNIFIHDQQSHCIPYTTIKHHTYEDIIRKLPPGPQHSLLSPSWFQPALHQGSSFLPGSTDHNKFIFSDWIYQRYEKKNERIEEWIFVTVDFIEPRSVCCYPNFEEKN